MDFLIGLWREASRFTEMGDTLERVAGLLAGRTGADVLVVRRIDMQRSAIETVASAAVRPGGPVVSSPRNECTPRCLDALVAWAMRGQPLRAQLPADDEMLNALGPSGWRGDLVAGPLNTDDGPAGVLLLLGARGTRLGPGDEQVVGDLLGPVTVALGNHSRLKELGRLREALEADRQALLNRLERQDVSDSIVGAGTGLRSVMARVDQVARTDAPVLVIGETGTGKEVVARAIHARSKRAGRPIVRVNCGAIPIGLVDSELFGHERGAFTGAIASRKGWFERADGGTLFLDEVGELPPDAQVRLLRILQDGTFERVGGQRTLTVDVRLVAATHRDLHDMVAQGTFREDLWYRISVFPIEIPPLRERVEDIPMLAAHFARSAGHRLRGRTLVPSASDAALLSRYGWPGNVRELAAVIERAAILGDGLELRVAAALGGDVAAPPAPMPGPPARVTRSVSEPLDARMRHHAQAALAWTGGRVDGPQGAAAVLKVNPHTLRARLRKLGVDWADFRPGASPGLARPAEAPSSWDAAMKKGIEDALVVASGRIEGVHGAAAALGVNPHTLRARMRKLGIDWATFRGASDPLSASYLS